MSIFIRKHHLISFVFIFITFVLIITVLIANSQKKLYRSRADENITPTPEASPSAQIALLETMIEAKNIETDNLINQYEQTIDEGEKQKIVSSLETNLTDRKNNLLSLLQLSPLSVYNKSFNQDKINKLNNLTSIVKDKRLIEARINTITGIVNTTIYDNFDNNTSYTTAAFIPDSNEEQEINFYPTDDQTFLSGTKVTLNDAVRIDEDNDDNNNQTLGVAYSVYAEEQEQPSQEQNQSSQPQSHLVTANIETIETPPLDALGEQKILVLLSCLDHLDCNQLPSPQEIEQRINNEISQFFKRDSYNNMSLVAYTTNKWLKLKKEFLGNNFAGRKKILSEFADEIDFKIYDRFGIILVGEYDVGGESSLGKEYKIKIIDKTRQSSLLTIYASSQRNYFFSPLYHTEDGDMSQFDWVFSHEFIHSLGGEHAQATNKKYSASAGNTFVSIDDFRTVNIEEYGNFFEIMGKPHFGLYSNAYIKKEFKWIREDTEANILRIDISKPEGEYTLKKVGSTGKIAAWLPYSSFYKEETIDYSSHVDQFLEYRKTLQQRGLVINFLEKIPKSSSHGLVRTILFPSSRQNNILNPSYQKNEIFIDQLHKVKIKVKDIDDSTNTLTFTIFSCNKTFLRIIPNRAGNDQFTSFNIFENDLRGESNISKALTVKEDFVIENTSLCFTKKYTIDQSSIIINQGNLYFSSPQFTTLSTEEVSPAKGTNNTFTTIVTINNPTLPDTMMEFTVAEQNLDKDKEEQPISKKLIYQFHVVPSTEEYKNDLEPYMIDIKDKDINNKEFNHLEANKGQTLIFTSKIGNNSRNPDGNKSSDFLMKWYIEDEKGNNVIPPFTQRHSGISPGRISDTPARLTFIVPKDLPIGDYKIILEVDSNDRLKEFNENNNMIFRYFSVVE